MVLLFQFPLKKCENKRINCPNHSVRFQKKNVKRLLNNFQIRLDCKWGESGRIFLMGAHDQKKVRQSFAPNIEKSVYISNKIVYILKYRKEPLNSDMNHSCYLTLTTYPRQKQCWRHLWDWEERWWGNENKWRMRKRRRRRRKCQRRRNWQNDPRSPDHIEKKAEGKKKVQ